MILHRDFTKQQKKLGLLITFFFCDNTFFFWWIIRRNLIFTKKKNVITHKKRLAFHITFSFLTQITLYYQAKNRQIPLKWVSKNSIFLFLWILKKYGRYSRVFSRKNIEFLFLSKNRLKIVCYRVKSYILSSHFCWFFSIFFENKDLLGYFDFREEIIEYEWDLCLEIRQLLYPFRKKG